MIKELKEFANTKKCQYSQIECSPTQMIKDAKTVEILLSTLQEWNAKPWNTVIPTFHSLQSGLLASKELVKDFNFSKEEGEK